MHKPLLVLSTLLSTQLLAQCPFDPTITPIDLILCPSDQAELTTQQYDSYQWYINGFPIIDGTSQNLPVSFGSAGNSFTVEVSLDGCVETSPAVSVEGYFFTMPALTVIGDQPYAYGPEGEAMFCEGANAHFQLPPWASQQILWYFNGEELADAHSQALPITEAGTYLAITASATCPNDVLSTLPVTVQYTPPSQPTIMGLGEQLCANPSGTTVQWYLNGVSYGNGSDCITPTEAGSYTVFVDNGLPCQVLSEPWISTGIGEQTSPAFSVAPSPASSTVRISWPTAQAPVGTWNVMDLAGRTVLQGRFTNANAVELDVQSLPAGRYTFRAVGDAAWSAVPVVVVR